MTSVLTTKFLLITSLRAFTRINRWNKFTDSLMPSGSVAAIRLGLLIHVFQGLAAPKHLNTC